MRYQVEADDIVIGNNIAIIHLAMMRSYMIAKIDEDKRVFGEQIIIKSELIPEIAKALAGLPPAQEETL